MFFVIPVKVVPPYGAGELNGLNEKGFVIEDFFVIPVKVVPPYGAGELSGLSEKKSHLIFV